MDYSEQVIADYENRIRNIETNINTFGIFPNRKNPLKPLDIGAETVLKTIFRFRVGFLEELTVLFSFAFSKQSFEALIIDLEEQGYIECKTSKDFGKYFIATKTALYYFYTDRRSDIAKTNFPIFTFPRESKLILRKCLNGLYSLKVFQKMVDELTDQYKQLDKEQRRIYTKKQFILQFLYPNENKGKAFSKASAAAYVEKTLKTFDESEHQEQFKEFVRYVKANFSDPFLRFHYLKDFLSELTIPKEEQLRTITAKLDLFINNVYSDRNYTYRKTLSGLSSSVSLHNEAQLYKINEYTRILTAVRNSLMSSQKDGKSEEELKSIIERIRQLDNRLADITKRRDTLLEDFEEMVFDKMATEEISIFTETHITFETLRDMGVFLTYCYKRSDNNKLNLVFSIIQPSSEEVAISYLFKRIEAVFKFAQKHLVMFNIEIQIATHTEQQKEMLDAKLEVVKRDFQELTEYSLLVLMLFETGNIETVATKQHLSERYEFFRELKTKIQSKKES